MPFQPRGRGVVRLLVGSGRHVLPVAIIYSGQSMVRVAGGGDDGRMYPDQYPPYQYQPVYVAAPPPTSGLAVTSLVMGIIGLLGGWCAFGIPCILAVILGHMATPATRSGERGGHGMAVAGLVLGYLFVIPAIVLTFWVALGMVVPGPEVAPTSTP